MSARNLKLNDTIILFDRDLGISIFQNFRGYDNLIDDAEWLLERTPQKSRGFLIRPVNNDGRDGIWIGEYSYNSNKITRQDILFDRNASLLNKQISDYSAHKIAEKKMIKKLAIDVLKKKLKSEIVQNFKYYICPVDRFYYSCAHINKIYEALMRKYGRGKKILYSTVAEEIANTKPCEDVIVCPLLTPNTFERILNLKKAFKARKLGETLFISSDTMKII
ncbi:MAG: hypothetical protein QXX08_06765 [Candidatus Bathyarchaeia archaeon]